MHDNLFSYPTTSQIINITINGIVKNEWQNKYLFLQSYHYTLSIELWMQAHE